MLGTIQNRFFPIGVNILKGDQFSAHLDNIDKELSNFTEAKIIKTPAETVEK